MDDTVFRMMYGAASSKPGQLDSTAPGEFSWRVPNDVYSISAVCIGAGQGGGDNIGTANPGEGGWGGDLRYAVTLPVTPGELLTLTIGAGGVRVPGELQGSLGGMTSIKRGATALLVAAGGGWGSAYSSPLGGNIGGGNGGRGGLGTSVDGHGGGGAGGYTGNGGDARSTNPNFRNGTGGAGGAGGGGFVSGGIQGGGGGGGVGLLGTGASGLGQAVDTRAGGLGGSGGADGIAGLSNGTGASGGAYGGGAGGRSAGGPSVGGIAPDGALRIIWGDGRAYPSTRIANEVA